MNLQTVFWMIYIVSVLFGFWINWPLGAANGRSFGGHLIIMVLIGLLGWALFGGAIHR